MLLDKIDMVSPPSAPPPPRLSVIMAVYNAERWLAEAVESVLSQTFTDFEFLIHDDGSSDNSPLILKQYAETDDRIIISSGPNQGLPASLNQLIKSARSDLLARMDADDICHPDRFERQVAYLDTHPDIAVLGSFIRYIDQDGRYIRDMDCPLNHADIDARNIAGANAINHPTVTMRRPAVLAVGGYDESFSRCEDFDLWLRMAEHFKLANYPSVLLDYRFHPFSMSASREAQVANNLRARQLAAKRRGLPEPTPIQPWRPALDRKSQAALALQWAWQGWKNGYPETARHYFLKALRLDPFSRAVWHGVIFGLLKKNKSHQ